MSTSWTVTPRAERAYSRARSAGGVTAMSSGSSRRISRTRCVAPSARCTAPYTSANDPIAPPTYIVYTKNRVSSPAVISPACTSRAPPRPQPRPVPEHQHDRPEQGEDDERHEPAAGAGPTDRHHQKLLQPVG